jgi:hypothetical protein
MPDMKFFLQFAGHSGIELVDLSDETLAGDIEQNAAALGFANAGESFVFRGEDEEPLDPKATLKRQGVKPKDRLHVHHCRKIKVSVVFASREQDYSLAPSLTVAALKRRFVKDIGMSAVDASEHVLELASGGLRPDPDVQIGCLTTRTCSLAFVLVPVKRVEG